MCVRAFIRVRPGALVYVSVRVYNWVSQKKGINLMYYLYYKSQLDLYKTKLKLLSNLNVKCELDSHLTM
jgi:hypothetical protein